MTEGHAAIVIARPLDELWVVLTDPEKTPRWSASAVEERWLTPPPVRVGSRRLAVTRGLGRTSRNVAEVTAYEPGRSWTMTSVSGPRFVATAEFATVEDGTRIDFTWSFALAGALRLIEPLVVRAFMSRFEQDLARLKSMTESGRL
jgi:uncharacterized protein YndB with AHSA1/START domain